MKYKITRHTEEQSQLKERAASEQTYRPNYVVHLDCPWQMMVTPPRRENLLEFFYYIIYSFIHTQFHNNCWNNQVGPKGVITY